MAKEKLFRLIHSLSSQEKKFFHHYANRHVIRKDPSYLRLFDAIAAQNEYDEQAVKKIIGKKGSEKNFHKAKSYLYDLIVRTLVILKQETSPYSRILQLLSAVEIFFEKQLFVEALELLQRARALALENELGVELALTTYRWEDAILTSTQTIVEDSKVIEEKYTKRMSLIRQITSLTDMRLIYMRYICITRKGVLSESAQRRLLGIFDTPILHRLTKPESPLEQRMFYMLKMLEARLLGERQDSVKYMQRIIPIVENYSRNFFWNESLMILSYFVLIKGLIELNDEKTAAYYLEKIKDIQPRTKQNKYFHSVLFFFCKLHYLKLSERFDDCRSLIAQYDQDLKNNQRGVNHLIEYRNYQAIINFFVSTGAYHDALRFVNRMLNDKGLEENAAPLFMYARLMNLILHFELKDFEIMDSLVRQTEFYFSSRKIHLQFVTVILKFLKKMIKAKGHSIGSYEDLGKELKSLLENYPEHLHLHSILESGWLMQHGVDIPFEKPQLLLL